MRITSYLLSFLVSLGVFSVDANECNVPLHFVSDFDDTIKSYSNSDSHGLNLLARTSRTKKYPGVSSFFAGARGICEANRISILTGAPKALRRNVVITLEKDIKIPYDQIVIRASTSEDIGVYKKREIEKIMIASPKIDHVLIGDNTSKDTEVYLEAKSKHPNQVKAIYIHRRDERSIVNKNVIQFHLYLEVALSEYRAKRINLKTLENVIEETKNADMEDLFPDNHHCPTQYVVSQSGIAELDAKNRIIQSRVNEYCRKQEAVEDEERNDTHSRPRFRGPHRSSP